MTKRTVYVGGCPLGLRFHQLGTIVDGQVSNDLAEYLIARDTPSGRRGFLIYLIRGADGLWRLAQF